MGSRGSAKLQYTLYVCGADHSGILEKGRELLTAGVSNNKILFVTSGFVGWLSASRSSTTAGPSCDWIPPLLKSSRDGTPNWNKGGDLSSFKGHKGWVVSLLVNNGCCGSPDRTRAKAGVIPRKPKDQTRELKQRKLKILHQ
ncbi:hypothetical protein HAX54_016947, partial [Datura stramonium]|nr:hypothetical protein [Datura stramonium]